MPDDERVQVGDDPVEEEGGLSDKRLRFGEAHIACLGSANVKHRQVEALEGRRW
jgi:hypothetical protein